MSAPPLKTVIVTEKVTTRSPSGYTYSDYVFNCPHCGYEQKRGMSGRLKCQSCKAWFEIRRAPVKTIKERLRYDAYEVEHMIADAVEAEREACARIADGAQSESVSATIRARTEAPSC